VTSFPCSRDAYRVLVGPYHEDEAPKRGPRPGCLILLSPPRGSRSYPAICISIPPSLATLMRKSSVVVIIGVGRRSVGRDNSTRRRHPRRTAEGVFREVRPYVILGSSA
jgi:hypothetical protein